MTKQSDQSSRGMHAIRLPQLLGLVGVLVMGGFGAGCVSYTNVPVPESAPAFESANHTQSIAVVRAALIGVINRHPVDGAYFVNLPAGTTPETFEKIASRLPGEPMMPTDELRGEFDSLPTYHIGRIWIRASDAKVDVIYPFTGMDGTTSMENVTVWLSGGVRHWRIYRYQNWSAGTIPMPPMYVPIVEDLTQGGSALDQSDDLSEPSAAPDSHASQPEMDSAMEPVTEPAEEAIAHQPVAANPEPNPEPEQTTPEALYQQVPINGND